MSLKPSKKKKKLRRRKVSDNITGEMVKLLRERTGVGMSKCKDALVRAGGSIEKAIEILRKEGLASAVKKEGRETKEGLIAPFETDDTIALVEVNCETDFVAQNSAFKVFLSDISEQAAETKPASLAKFIVQNFSADPSMTIDGYRNLLVQKLGENIQIKKVEIIGKKSNCSYGIYLHMGGKIVTVVEIEGSQSATEIAKEIAMHVAAEAPEYLNKQQVPKEILEKEKEIASSQIKNKPANIVEKIVEGKMNSFYDTVCLVNQKFVKDPSLSVLQYVETAGLKSNQKLFIKRFWYWKVGQ
jgi:elongation factor Ts